MLQFATTLVLKRPKETKINIGGLSAGQKVLQHLLFTINTTTALDPGCRSNIIETKKNVIKMLSPKLQKPWLM